MASLVYGFIRASDDGWSDPLTVTAFVAAAVLLAVFVLVESRAAQPIIPLRMFGDRNRVGSYVVILCLVGAMYGMFFFVVQFFQIVLGYSPIRSGLASLTFTAGLVIAVGITQRLLPVLGPKPFVVIGSALSVAGLGWLTFIGPGTTFVGGVMGPLFVFGAGCRAQLRHAHAHQRLGRRPARGRSRVGGAQRLAAGRRVPGSLHHGDGLRDGEPRRGGAAVAVLPDPGPTPPRRPS